MTRHWMLSNAKAVSTTDCRDSGRVAVDSRHGDPGDGTAHQPDVHTTAGKLADLYRRNDEAIHAGSERAVERQHARGKKTARERIDMLLDPGSFVELDELARHRSTNFGQEHNRPYGDRSIRRSMNQTSTTTVETSPR